MKTYHITYLFDDCTTRKMSFDAESEREARLLAWEATAEMDEKIVNVKCDET